MKAIVTLCLFAAAQASACDRVEYAEAKTWSTEKLQRAYCADLTESLNRVIAQIERKMSYAKSDLDLCSQQQALYKRLIESRGKELKSCKQ